MTNVSCPACGAPLDTRYAVVSDPESLEAFSVLGCSTCGLGRTDPIPQDLGRYYVPTYHGQRHGITERFCFARRLRRTKKALATTGRRLLDVGCGDGTFLSLAKSQGFETAGTELNPTRARAAGHRVFESLAEAQGAGPFDIITSWHSFEHFPDVRTTLAEMRSLLRPDGVLLLAVPNARSFQARLFGRYWFHLDTPRHLWHFGSDSLSGLLKRCNLTPVRRFGGEIEYDLFGWIQSALNAVVGPPNTFFRALTGKDTGVGLATKLGHLALGTMFGLVFALPAAIEALTKRSGTLVLASKLRSTP